jgi:hypothetical protein
VKRPLLVTLVACVYILVGTIGFLYHFGEFWRTRAFHWDFVVTELSELLAVLFGIFLLRGQNWARWGALAWMLFHVVISAFGAFREFAVHALICVVITWCLFRPEAARYFGAARTEGT